MAVRMMTSFWGGEGDDFILGGTGSDNLYGQSGADTFLFKAISAGVNGIDTIHDFSTVEGDKLDVSDILAGTYNAGTDVITDFVQITDNGTDSTLSVDADGTANGTNFVQIAALSNTTGLTDEVALETNGTLVTV